MLDLRSDSTWTDARIENLKRMWSEGLTCSQIAGELGGVSRNAVIAKVHRLGLPGRGQSKIYHSSEERREARNAQRRSSSKTHIRARKLAQLVCPDATHETALEFLHKQLLELKDPISECRFAHGDHAPYTFCAQPVAHGTSWCSYHLRIVERQDA